MTLTPGTRLGPYEIQGALGAGGMGEVYRARDTRLERTVAIKVLPTHIASDPGFRQRFEREAKAISQLNHPNICTLYDIGEADVPSTQPPAPGADKINFLVMEYLEGETLAKRLEAGPLPIEQALRHATEIADALDKAHRQGVVHRDLKPGNIMLTRSGGPSGPPISKLLDFGLAKLQVASASSHAGGVTAPPTLTTPLTGHGAVLGTIQYMAPEQLEGREADARSDIFAFGALVYEMVTARKAFDGRSQASLITAIMSSEPPPLSSLQAMTPAALDRIVRTCLAKDPEDRWQTARDLTRELRWVAKEFGVASTAGSSVAHALPREATSISTAPVEISRDQQAASADAARRTVGWRRWRERLAWTLAILGAAAAAFLALRPTEPAGSPAGAIRFRVPPPEDTAFAGGTTAPLPAVSPDGRRIAFLANRGGGDTTIWVRALDSLDASPLRGTEEALSPFWSPDSKFIGFFAGGQLKKIDVSGGPPQTLCGAQGGEGGAWSAEGVIVFGSSSGGLSRVPAAGGEPTPVTTLDRSRKEAAHTWPSFLPDGRRFLFSALPSKAVFLGALDSKEIKQLLNADSKVVYAPPPPSRFALWRGSPTLAPASEGGGHLLFVRGGTLLTQPFDADRAELTGEAIPVAESIVYSFTGSRAVFSVSDSGVLVYRAGEATAPSRLTWFDRAGKATQALGTPGSRAGVTLSPDARRAVTHVHEGRVGGGLWLFDGSRGTTSRFTFDSSHNFVPVWSPDGSRVVFTSDRDGGTANLYQKLSTGAGPDELVLKSEESKWPTDWSLDGRLIVYQSAGTKTGLDLWTLPLGGDKKPEVFLQTPFNEAQGQLSPDGRWMAYASDESGRFEVYVQPFPPSGGKWQISTNGGMLPRWRRDGRELFYLGLDRRLLSVSVKAAGVSFEPDVPTALFDTRAYIVPTSANPYYAYAVTADGQRFLFTESLEGPESQPLTVVVDWLAALRRAP